MKYYVSRPSITDKERNYVSDVMNSGVISSIGEYIPQFENLFAQKHGAEYGVACSSGTTALVLALRAIGVGPGDEVIVPEFTMVATAWAVTMVGATPVFVDCGPDFNIDVDLIEERITSRTKAIMPVHLYGRQADMEAIMELAHDYGLRVIEDSAEAHGTPIMGDIACFSLYANKIITAGEGGICITNDDYFEEQMRHLRGMAFSPDHNFLHKKLGYNFRMTNLQGAVALAQTERLEEILEKRRSIEKWYDEGLEGLLPKLAPRDVLWMYDIYTEYRDELMAYLKKNEIETRMFFKPMSRQPMYQDDAPDDLYADTVSRKGMYLPTYTDMTKEDVDAITAVIRQFPKFVV